MWMVIYIAQTKEIADKIKLLLQEAGFLVKVRVVSLVANDKDGCYEILVPEAELAEAHSIIVEKIL